ncbi:MAG: alpha-glucan family phosphorylase [Kiritimatiellia bacterium]|jgi:starch phosphorylase
MTGFKTYRVLPKVPEDLRFLQTLANNVWWSWNIEASALFLRMDPALFREVKLNPVVLLAEIGQDRLEDLAADPSFIAHMKSVEASFNAEVLKSQHKRNVGDPHRCVAYFSMEFGLHESIHIYSGGLGILAGDHLKSASDLDIPLCGIGLFYREGYFEQTLDIWGKQIEAYPENHLHTLPISVATDTQGEPVRVSVPLPGMKLHAAVWRLNVGRIPLYLLDTNIPENPPELRAVTGRLYGGDKTNRLRQELLLGIGGMRALDAMGFEVAASHMNEGHAAFLGLERIAKGVNNKGISLRESHEFVRRTSIFTTHTPVPAGNETFNLGLVKPYLDAIEAEGGVSADFALSLGRAPNDANSQELSMTILGLSCSTYNNGVAKLHGIVERDMWKHLWPDFPVEEVPIGHVTNGVHVPTWIASDNSALYSTVLGPNWDVKMLTESQVKKIDHIRDEDLWRMHEASRAHLVRSARANLVNAATKRNASFDELAALRNVLNKDALTIGFARRFATYKRATLILSDLDRLKKILLNPSRPVQIIFAGKAHPADGEGKHLVERIAQFAKDPAIRGRVVFLENYNMRMARRLVRGVDVWLNTPRRPNEASGTSGMKACINGAIHVSTLDGWWPEGYDPSCGWAIGDSTEFPNIDQHDQSDAQALYNLLESEIIPTFYDRQDGELPLRWIAMMKESIKMSLNRFSSTRMVSDYFTGSYIPAMDAFAALGADNYAALRSDQVRVDALKAKWGGVSVSFPTAQPCLSRTFVGDEFPATVQVHLGDIAPEDVVVEFFSGRLDPMGQIGAGNGIEMDLQKKLGGGNHLYAQTVKCEEPGAFGFSARVMPRDVTFRNTMPGYMVWAVMDN